MSDEKLKDKKLDQEQLDQEQLEQAAGGLSGDSPEKPGKMTSPPLKDDHFPYRAQ